MTRRTPRLTSAEPTVLVLAGLDPSGKAGLLADLDAVRRAGARAFGIATALTAQGGKVFTVQAVSPRLIRDQLLALRESARIDAVKLGLVPNRRSLAAIAAGLRGLHLTWVVDPVTRTSLGQRLSKLSRSSYLSMAAPHVVLTPNAMEAAWLSGAQSIRASAEAARAGLELVEGGFGCVIVKGGHLDGEVTDVLCTRDWVRYLRGTRLPRRPTQRGTGCRYASTLAAYLAQGLTLETSARKAKRAVETALRSVRP